MITYTAKEAKNEFGKMLDDAQRTPVTITKHRREVGALLSMSNLQRIADTMLSEPLKTALAEERISLMAAIEEQLKINELRETALKQQQNGEVYESNTAFFAGIKAEALGQ